MAWHDLLAKLTTKQRREAIKLYHATTERLILQIYDPAVKARASVEVLAPEEVAEGTDAASPAESVKRYHGDPIDNRPPGIEDHRTAAAFAWKARALYHSHTGHANPRGAAIAELEQALRAANARVLEGGQA